jgi:DNA-binding transcriptional ArsR family regulator
LGALSQHLKILKEAGLVTERRNGRYRIYRINPEPLRELYEWTAQYETFWVDKMKKFGEVLKKHHESKNRS